MFSNKVNEQKLELLRAVFQNMYLKEKRDYLDSECKMLAEHIISSEVKRAEKDDLIFTLKKEINHLKEIKEQKLQELAKVNEEIVNLSSCLENTRSSFSSTDSKLISEQINVKDEMIKCLQEELIDIRLNEAEKWVLIRELQQINTELEQEKIVLSNSEPKTVARLQEELMTAQLHVAKYNSEFGDIKKQLTEMKSELCLLNYKRKNSKNEEVKLSINGVLWQLSSSKNKKNEDSQEILNNIQRLEEEKSYLESKIPELQSKIDGLNSRISLKEKERHELQEKLHNIKIKQQSNENIILDRKKQYIQLEKIGAEKVDIIRNNRENKTQDIKKLSNKLDQLETRRPSTISNFEVKETNTIKTLEKQILILQERINELNSEKEALECL